MFVFAIKEVSVLAVAGQRNAGCTRSSTRERDDTENRGTPSLYRTGKVVMVAANGKWSSGDVEGDGNETVHVLRFGRRGWYVVPQRM